MAKVENKMDEAIIRSLRRDGFAVLPGVIEKSLAAALRDEATQVVERWNTPECTRPDDYWHFHSDRFKREILYRVHNYEQHDCRRFVEQLQSGNLASLAQPYIAGRAFNTACALILKSPYVGAPVPWHRDRNDVAPHTVFNISIFLDTSSSQNGCIEFVPGSHQMHCDLAVDEILAAGPLVRAEANEGDIILHDVRVIHGSGPNSTPFRRMSIICEFAPEGGIRDE